MNKTQLTKIKRWFARHVETFLDQDSEGNSIYQIKVEHSQRVAHEMRQLAEALNWSVTDMNIAEAIGWLHDIGRFTQYWKFGTFHDAQSLNHGEQGRQVLLELDVLSALADDEQVCIMDAVCYHNAKTLPDHLQAKSQRMARLIRDADKLDIFHIVYEALVRDGFQDLPRMLPQVQLDGAINPVVMNQLRKDRACSFDEVKSLADFLLFQLSWVYDINFVPTMKQIAHRNILFYIAQWLPKNDSGINALLTDAECYVANQIRGEKGSCCEDQLLANRLRRAFMSIKPRDELVHLIRAKVGGKE